MKDSVLKIAVLAVLVTVFTAVAITARWMDNSDYDHISRTSQGSDEVSSGVNSSQQQAGTWDTGSRAEFSTVWVSRPASEEEQKPQEPSIAQRRSDWRANHPEEELDDGGEPPDEREDKDIWRSDIIE